MRGARYGALVLILAGCAWQGTPVPVGGELEGLRGEWEGSYSSAESGRSGAISFRLDAATDSAFGDVWMSAPQRQEVQEHDAPQMASPRPHTSESLRIAFVRSERGQVSGRLEVYRDPTSGDRLFTVFEGRLRGDEFKGTYRTTSEGSGRVVRGEWQAARVRTP